MKTLYLSIVAVALTACAVGPKYSTPETHAPPAWNASNGETTATEPAGAWWQEFHDDTLNSLVERAIKANLSVQAATVRVAESRTRLDAARGEHWPSVNFNGSYQRQRQSENGSATRLITLVAPPASQDAIIQALSQPYDLYQAGFDASWELDMWGRVRRSVESAGATHEATEEDLHDAQLSLAAEVARDYVALRGAQRQLDIVKADVATAEDLLKLTENRAAGGVATQLEVSSQKARVSDARSRVPSLEQGVQQLKDALALLLASQPGALDQELSSPQALPSLPANVSVGVPAELARRRPDVRRAEARLHAATAEIGVAVADLYPRITLTGSFVTESLNASDLTAWGSRQWTIGPHLYLPIFNGARLHSVVELRKLEQQEAAVNYQQTVLKSWHEVENSLASYSAELKRYQDLTDMVAASRDAYDIAKIRYEHGQTNYLVPLDAQRTLLQAERALSDNETQARTQLIGLYKALGGGSG